MERRVGKYLINEKIGSGAFGIVYKATDTETGRLIALKTIDKEKILEDNMLNAIKSEVLNMISCDHPHIVKLEAAFSTRKKFYLAMQLVEGEDFVDRINGQGFTELEARKYFKELCQAIQYLKENNMAHRDIKPENILIDKKDNVKLVDFGLSTFLKNPSVVFESELTTPCGTLQYTAPEIIKKQKYDPYASDVWSMGVVLYCIVSGRSPFHSDNIGTLLKNILNPVVTFDFECSESFEKLVTSMLHPNPAKRPTIQTILKDQWLNCTEKQLTPKYKGPKHYHLHKEWDISCRKIDAIELSLALFNLALAKTMSSRKNCLLTKNHSLTSIHRILSNFKPFQLIDMTTGYKAQIKGRTIIEIYCIKEGVFLLKITTEDQLDFNQVSLRLAK